jgi:SAM-dependent methyltransferase
MADQGTEGLLSPYLRRKRFEAAIPYLKGRVLDFGCGTGALAAFVDRKHYLGVDVDEESLQHAQFSFPEHRFVPSLSEAADTFDTIILLAVIEHVSEPAEVLRTLATHLYNSADSRIVITTPHPLVGWVHKVGAAVGLFSKHANEEHEDLLNSSKLEMVGIQAGLQLVTYRRFLFGANQVAVFDKGNL